MDRMDWMDIGRQQKGVATQPQIFFAPTPFTHPFLFFYDERSIFTFSIAPLIW
jgi:hypothetical protein